MEDTNDFAERCFSKGLHVWMGIFDATTRFLMEKKRFQQLYWYLSDRLTPATGFWRKYIWSRASLGNQPQTACPKGSRPSCGLVHFGLLGRVVAASDDFIKRNWRGGTRQIRLQANNAPLTIIGYVSTCELLQPRRICSASVACVMNDKILWAVGTNT